MQKRKKKKQASSEKFPKSPKLDENSPQICETLDEKTVVGEVKKLLKSQETLLTGLTKLRDAFRGREGKGFKVFTEFVKDNSECPDLYKALEKGRQNQSPLELQIALEVLEKLLLFTADSTTHVGVGMYHVRKILQHYLKLLYSCLNPAGHSNMVKATLRLLGAMVAQGASAGRELVAVFDFTLKAFGSLVNRKEIKNHDSIRSCYIKFSLSFLMFGDDATIRHILDVKGFLQSIFKMLPSDPSDVIIMTLKALHEKVVKNLQVPKKSKVQFFNSYVLSQLTRLFNYNTNQEDDDNVRKMAHEILQDVCCTFKYGICFANKLGMFAGRSNNPVLLRFLQSIPKSNHQPNVQQLIIQILTCCPDLVQPYLTNLKTTYEPRLSLPWLANVNFVIKLYSALPLPSVMIQKANVELNEAVIQALLNSVYPVGLTRMNLNQGIQHTSRLVKDTTLVLMLVVLNRATDLLDFCQNNVLLLKMDSFAELFRDALSKVLPDIKTVISLRQNLLVGMDSKAVSKKDENIEGAEGTTTEQSRPTLLLAKAVQVLHGYQKVLPLIFSNAAFDLGKLLPGKDEFLDNVFPSIVQYYTLQILLNVPPSSFKWYQQKSKDSPSNMYSILKILVKSNEPDVKSIAKSLVKKFLHDEGIVSEHSYEIEVWLKHLHNKTFCENQEALLLFLDSVCSSVALEPYTYSDIVTEMTSEARQCSGLQLSFLEDSVNGLARIDFSPLLVKVLMLHVEMVTSSSPNIYTVDQLGAIARYINLVVLDLHCMLVDPLPLLLTVHRFYGNIRWPNDYSCLRNIHESLFQYVSTWIGKPPQVGKAEKMDDRNPKKALETFYREPVPTFQSLVKVLSHLDEDHLSKEIVTLLQHCFSRFQGDITRLVDLLITTPFCLIGSGVVNEAMFPLLNNLPFSNLTWQIFGPLMISLSRRGVHKTSKLVCFDAIRHPGLQTHLMESLQREETSHFPALCNHLLNYLSVLVSVTRDSKFVDFEEKQGSRDTKNVTIEKKSVFMTAFALIFQLIEAMIDILNETFGDLSKNSYDGISDKDGECIDPGSSCVTLPKDGIRDFCKTLFGHPVFYMCFLQNWESKDAISPSLTLCVSNILRRVINLVEKELIKPYIEIICSNAIHEVNNALQGGDLSSDGQALQLLQTFSRHCDQQDLVKIITLLLELPLDRLLHQNQQHTLFYQALLSLLNVLKSPITFTSKAIGSSWSNDRTSLEHSLVSTTHRLSSRPNVGLAEISVPNFERLIDLAMAVPTFELDDIVHKLIKTSPKFMLVLKPTFLDFCLDKSTSERISISITLISSNLCLRRHFERRCVSENKSIVNLREDALIESLPVIHCYLLMAIKNAGFLLENEVVVLLMKKYWPLLWSWLVNGKSAECRTKSPSCSVLELLIRLKANDDVSDLKERVTELLSLVSKQSLDICQIYILCVVVKSLPSKQDNATLIWQTISACMQNVSTTLNHGADSSSTVETTLELLNEVVTTNADLMANVGDEDLCMTGEEWATFVRSCLKHNFNSIKALKCIAACVKPLYTMAQLKSVGQIFPLTMMYEMILSHSRFLEVIMDDSKENHCHKEAVLNLVVAIADLSPDCCQDQHISVLFAAYTASLSKTDQMLLYLLHLYERAHTSLSSYRPYLWGKAALNHYKVRKMQGPSLWQQPSTNEVLELLDESLLNQSAMEFPLERSLRPRVQQDIDASQYDPSFLIPLFSHLLSPNSEVNCRKFVERGCLGYTVAGLSSRDEHVRKAASHVLSRYMTHLEASSFREKKQVHLLLVSFKNGISDVNTRVSSVITRFIARAAHVMLHPEQQMYFLLNSFLLQRAVMDLREVPLFYTLFNSSSLQYRYERIWILELLREGLCDAQDYYVYKKRHVMELAMSFHDSQLSDQQSRKLVIDLVSAALTIHSATFDLARNYGIVGWIHTLGLVSGNEGLSTSLRLLHTLWFTIQRGKPGTCNNVHGDVDDVELKQKPFPPNLAEETLLVCKTFIRYFSCNSKELESVCLLFDLVSSAVGQLHKDSTQRSQLTNKELLVMITLWSDIFGEREILTTLMKEVGFTMADYYAAANCNENKEFIERKAKTFNQLIEIITVHRPKHPDDPDRILLACNFALEIGCYPWSRMNPTSRCLHLGIITWFRTCLVTSPCLQTMVLGSDHCLQRLLNLYDLTGQDVLLKQELNMIFMTLMSHVHHVKKTDVLGTSANKVAGLLQSDVYAEVITSGLIEVIFPLHPHPDSGEQQKNEIVDGAITEMLSIFLQDLWFGQLIPSHFLDIVTTSKNDASKKLASIFLNGSPKLQGLLQTNV